VPKRIFAVLYVSVMGLTRCYKTTVFFYIYNDSDAVDLMRNLIVICTDVLGVMMSMFDTLHCCD